MIITCPKCSTYLKCAPDKVDSKGKKVRCPKCKFIFGIKRTENDQLSNELPFYPFKNSNQALNAKGQNYKRVLDPSFMNDAPLISGNQKTIREFLDLYPPDNQRKPFIGLDSFRMNDQDYFFGRKAIIERLSGKILSHKTIIINGQSGSGKTSLIEAGLIPRLCTSGYTFILYRDYSDPIKQLLDYFNKYEGLTLKSQGANFPLSGIIRKISRMKKNRLIIFFDQFEKFFLNESPDKRNQFIHEIKACLESGIIKEDTHFVISIRQKYFGQLITEFESIIPMFFHMSGRYNLLPFSSAEAKEVILKPIRMLNPQIQMDKAFVTSRLIPDLMKISSMNNRIDPYILQIVCSVLYNMVVKRFWPDIHSGNEVHIDYSVYKILEGAKSILDNYPENQLEEIVTYDQNQLHILQTIIKQMVHSTGTYQSITISNISKILPNVSSQTIEQALYQLRQCQLIKLQGYGQNATYSIIHEVIADKVMNWYDEREMQRMRVHNMLKRGLLLWKRQNQLLEESELKLIQQWMPKSSLSKDAERLILESTKYLDNQSMENKRQIDNEALVEKIKYISIIILIIFIIILIK